MFKEKVPKSKNCAKICSLNYFGVNTLFCFSIKSKGVLQHIYFTYTITVSQYFVKSRRNTKLDFYGLGSEDVLHSKLIRSTRFLTLSSSGTAHHGSSLDRCQFHLNLPTLLLYL